MPYIVENETDSMEDFPNPMDFLNEDKSTQSPQKKVCKHQRKKEKSQIESYRLQSEVELPQVPE